MTKGVIGGNISLQCCVLQHRGYKYMLTLSCDRAIFYDEWNDTFDNVRAYCLFIARIYSTTTAIEMSKRHVLILYSTEERSFTCSIYERSFIGMYIEVNLPNGSSKDSVSLLDLT